MKYHGYMCDCFCNNNIMIYIYYIIYKHIFCVYVNAKYYYYNT